jgi:hypothetical protein
MRKFGVFAVIATAWATAACSRGGGLDASAPEAPQAKSRAPGQPMGNPAAGAEAAANSPSTAATGGADREEAPSADERPGLGTEFGESRESRISTTSFTREHSDRPFDALRLFYNDATGARAMAQRAGVNDLGSAQARTREGAITVRLLDASGSPLQGFSSGSNTYVVGSAGDRYTIQIRNNTGSRFEAVTTVDGLDVINGRTGSLSNRGYIVNGFSTVEIDGWRRSTDTVAAFRFGKVSQSYAGKKGEDRNVGVIGVAVFEEQGASFSWTEREIDRRHGADPFPGSSRSTADRPLAF